jgi:proteasome beta subunit
MSTYTPGATVLGLKTKDYVILSAEKRMTYGGFVVAKHVKKVFKITDSVGAAAAGLIADMQELFRQVSSLVKLRELETGKKTPVKGIAKLTSKLLYSHKLYPYYTQILIGGYVDKPGLYSLDPLGSVIEDNFMVIGTGAEIAIGILESGYREDLSVEDATELVTKAVKTAIGRDALSGDGLDIMIIDENGIRETSLIF